MELEMIREEFIEQMAGAERILIGIGAEWKYKDEEREAKIQAAAKKLREMVDGKDYFVITTLEGKDAGRLGFESTHMVVPFDVSLTEEAWNGYMNWLSRTLNRKLVILELGEGFMNPTVVRWPFEKTVAINNKARMYRVHKTFYQVPDEIKEKAVAVKADSVEFFV